MMETIFIVSTIAVAAVAITALLLYHRNQRMLQHLEKQLASNKVKLPLKLQAHERCIVFLERISPDSLLVRVGNASSVMELQSKLLSSIRAEFEHNLSQQLYVSEESWTYLVNAKNNIVGLVNSCSTKLNPADNAIELSKVILETYAQFETPITFSAKHKLKQDMNQL